MKTPDSDSVSALDKAMAKLRTDVSPEADQSSSTPPSALRKNKDREATTSPTVDSFSYQLDDAEDSVSTITRSSYTDKPNHKSKYVEWDDEFLHRPGEIEEDAIVDVTD